MIDQMAENLAAQKLEQDRRTLGPTRIIRDEQAVETITAEQRDRVIAAATKLKESRGITWGAVAKGMGCTQSQLSALLNRYPGGRWQFLVADLDRWIETASKGDQSPKPIDYVTTEVAVQIQTVANAACVMNSLAYVRGWSGIGKSMALRAIAAEKPGTIYVAAGTACAGPIAMARRVAAAAGIKDTATATLDRITQRLEMKLADSGRLLVIDGIDEVAGKEDRALFWLKDLFDATRSPQLWSGTIDLAAYLDRRIAGGKESLSKIRRRIGIVRDLCAGCGAGGDGDGQRGAGELLFSIDDVRRVFHAGKMRLTPEAIRYLFVLANMPDAGSLGTCANLVAMAARINPQVELTAAMLRQVHQLLAGAEYGVLESRMVDADGPQLPLCKIG